MGGAMHCPFCDYDNPFGATACGFCAAILPDENAEISKARDSILDTAAGKQIRCSYCWKLNPATNAVCGECGMPLAYVPHPDKKGKHRRLQKRGEVWNPVPEGMVRCLGCWHDNPEGSVLCEKCGIQLMKPSEMPDYESIKAQQYALPKPNIVLRGLGKAAAPLSSDFYVCEPTDPSEEDEGLLEFLAGELSKPKLTEEERRKIEQSKNRSEINHATPGMLRCRNCWHDNPTDATLCEECGARLQPDRPTPKTRKKHWPGDP